MIDMRAKFVAVSIYTVASGKRTAFEASAQSTIERDASALDGFCEGIVMTNEEQTQVLIVTLWAAKDAWAKAQWEPRIQDAVAQFTMGAKAYDLHTFVPVTVVRA